MKPTPATVALYQILLHANKQYKCSHPNPQKCLFTEGAWHNLCLTCGKTLD